MKINAETFLGNQNPLQPRLWATTNRDGMNQSPKDYPYQPSSFHVLEAVAVTSLVRDYCLGPCAFWCRVLTPLNM